jgi:hypothetical protein
LFPTSKKDYNPRNSHPYIWKITGYRLNDRGVGVWVAVGSRNCPDQLYGPPKLLSNGYQRLFPFGGRGGWRNSRSVKLTCHLQIVPRLRKCESIHPLLYAFMA